jgi:hypothetical protein
MIATGAAAKSSEFPALVPAPLVPCARPAPFLQLDDCFFSGGLFLSQTGQHQFHAVRDA